jgi:hypothetical protein
MRAGHAALYQRIGGDDLQPVPGACHRLRERGQAKDGRQAGEQSAGAAERESEDEDGHAGGGAGPQQGQGAQREPDAVHRDQDPVAHRAGVQVLSGQEDQGHVVDGGEQDAEPQPDDQRPGDRVAECVPEAFPGPLQQPHPLAVGLLGGKGRQASHQRGRDPEAQGVAPQRPADARTGDQDTADGWTDGPLKGQGHPHPGVGPHQISRRDKARHDTSTRGREHGGEQRGGGYQHQQHREGGQHRRHGPIQQGLPRLGAEHQAALLDTVDQGAGQRAQQGGQGGGKQQRRDGHAPALGLLDMDDQGHQGGAVADVGDRLGGPQTSEPRFTAQQPPARLRPRVRVVHHRISSLAKAGCVTP